MSLTELAFILFFLLLLLALARDQIRRQEISNLNQAKDALQSDADSWTHLASALRGQGVVPEDLSEDSFRRLVRDAERSVRLEEEKAELQSRLAEAEQEVAEAKVWAQESEAQVAEVRQKAEQVAGQLGVLQNQCGVGFPPCWVSPDGKIEYIYRVTVREESVDVEPAWPASREIDLATIPRARELVGDGQSLSTFRVPANSVLEWSRSQEPECRHYVLIADRAGKLGRSYKAKRLLVENYFYKYELRENPELPEELESRQ